MSISTKRIYFYVHDLHAQELFILKQAESERREPSGYSHAEPDERELVALLRLSSWCLVTDVWLFLAVPWICLQFVIVVFPDHTHYFHTMNSIRILQKLIVTHRTQQIIRKGS